MWNVINESEMNWSWYMYEKKERKKERMLDDFKMLGLNSSCTEEEIKKAYRKLASIYHPDKHIKSFTFIIFCFILDYS